MKTRWFRRLAYALHLKRRPSMGLLQFVPSTFAANADDYTGSVYDPESQMRAWYRYVGRDAK